MTEFNPITGPFPSPATEQKLREALTREQQKNRDIRAKVDAAGTDEFSTRLFQNADSLGPNAAFSEGVRQRVRDRGRHANLNNNYARGLVRTHASDLIGACPKPQLTIPGDESGEVAEAIERGYMRWAKEIKLGHTYRLAEKCRGHSGEAFLFAADNPKLKHPVKLTIRDFEPEQCVTPWNRRDSANIIDGIEFDEFGNRIFYHVLRYHPGESYTVAAARGSGDFMAMPASKVFHWFEQDRPGQVRGLVRISAALPIMEQVRRWNLATLTAIEFASMIAGIIKSRLPMQDGQPASVKDWDFYEVVKGALMTLPADCDASQMEAKHPNAQFSEFKREQLNEAGRGSGAPLNVMTGNSSGYNYSSGRLDHVPYQRDKRIDRFDFQSCVMDPVFLLYVEEARMVGLIEASVPAVEEWGIAWNYDGFGSIDEQKDANTDDIRLANGTTNFAEVESEYNRDWRQQLKQLAKEVKAYAAEGLVHPFVAAQKAAASPHQPDQQPADQNDAESRLFAALIDNGIPDHVADQVVSEFFAPFLARHKPSLNGHAHPIGGRA